MSAIESVEQHIYGILSGDSTLSALVPGGWHFEIAPRATEFPFGIISAYVPGSDRNIMGTGPKRAFTRFEYLVKAITKGGSFDAGFAIMDRVEALIGGSHASKVLGIYRTGLVKYVENDGDIRYNHFGHLYRAIGRD